MTDWKLLSETRRTCLRTVMVGTTLVVLLFFAQTVAQTLVDIEAQAWGWVMLVVLPVLLSLWASTMLNRYPAKIVHPNAHQGLVWGSVAYQLFLLLTLFAEPFALNSELSVLSYLSQALWWLIPLELLLLFGYWLVFYKKELFFKPSEQIILGLAAQKALESNGRGHLLQQQCFELLASNDLPGLLRKMKTEFEQNNKSDFNATILLENQFNSVNRERSLNTIDPQEAQIALNRIVMSAINLVEKM